MQGGAAWEALKVWLYAAASVVLGAWAAPLVYNAGKALAEVSSRKETNGPLEWLADRCRAAPFPTFFEASLALSAALLAVPYARSLPRGLIVGYGVRPDSGRFRELTGAFLKVVAVMLPLSLALAYARHGAVVGMDFEILRTGIRWLPLAIALASVEEWFFRGLAMGAFLAVVGPAAAIALSSVLFLMVHLVATTASLQVADPDAPGTGFEMLGVIAAYHLRPGVVLSTVVPLLGIGGVLGLARHRAGSLFLPIGLHAGWIFSNALTTQPSAGLWVALVALTIAFKWPRQRKIPNVSTESTD